MFVEWCPEARESLIQILGCIAENNYLAALDLADELDYLACCCLTCGRKKYVFIFSHNL